ncbi:MAG TPA: hypothetical protein VKR32_06440, partial [Puia sp.]|nr:hypothetical protein [Puia sp.]
FLFTLVFSSQIYAGHEMPLHITDAQMPVLMEIYAAGFIAIYSLFTLMYRHALARSSFLELTEAERFDCRTIMYKQVIMVSVGVSALFSAMIISAQYSGITGFIYVLIGPALTPFFFRRKKIRDRLFPEEKEVNA